MSVGRVLSVSARALGTTVITTVVGDNTTKLIPVDFNVVNFGEESGWFQHQPTGDVYAYDTADIDAETITLTSGLPVGKTLTAGDALYVVDSDFQMADDFYADVAVDDISEDVVSARVPQGLRTIVAEGTRERKKGPLVRLEAGSEEWEITEILGQEPGLEQVNFPRLRLTKGATNTAGGTNLAIGWDSAQVDTDGMWDAGTPNIIRPLFTGQYLVTLRATWASNGTGFRALWMEDSTDAGANFTLMGALRDRSNALGGADVTTNDVSMIVTLNASSLYRVMRFQDSGGVLQLNTAHLGVIRLGPE